ncbi:uncharacterized protein CLUP02_13733 [Colletotrichum lupini]|uniref:Uncharacterized protein n=2 Tax=Colletotrichum acutatum species complex TaxID=2707335 RepID=A0A9Q8T3N1_9PEZI|nr:uncharacterized protein CLUP02_13733 [Colletotrichum lupini]XP_060387974.1 uncharacterized protein CTAM01_01471 [Colletotrichum tamarilloi]KAK1510898.1 hypothetical protein CTAM01_01471 [Colletotrichum tamarilloi]UQC88210.1 hypothetical protein CLUP02_13733 [Colletotrichum lupini]
MAAETSCWGAGSDEEDERRCLFTQGHHCCRTMIHQQVAGLRGRMAQKRTRTMDPGKLQHVELPREV